MDASEEGNQGKYQGDRLPTIETEKGWRIFAVLLLGFVSGLMFAYLINTELAAKAKAAEICNTCQENLKTMVANFNAISGRCTEAATFNLTPYIGTLNLTGGQDAP